MPHAASFVTLMPLLVECESLIVLRPTGAIDFEVPKGSGYIAHPAVTDNCMQLGPVSGLAQLGPGSADDNAAATRCASVLQVYITFLVKDV